jgi:hypothetical protein
MPEHKKAPETIMHLLVAPHFAWLKLLPYKSMCLYVPVFVLTFVHLYFYVRYQTCKKALFFMSTLCNYCYISWPLYHN